MKRIAVATDSNSGITKEEGELLGIRVLPMPFYIDGKVYYEGDTLTRDDFFRRQEQGVEINTSQPTPEEVTNLWEELLRTHEEVIYIPMSSGLSGSCNTAMVLSKDYNGRVHVIDNQRISVPQRLSVCDAFAMVESGMPSDKIIEVLMREKLEASIYITVDTLTYLKKGGRITPAAAAIGSVLHIKPVLSIQGDKLDAYAKAKGWKMAWRIMLDALEKDMETRFQGNDMQLAAAYSCTEAEAEEWKEQIKERFHGADVLMNPLPLSICCHTGSGAMALGCAKKLSM